LSENNNESPHLSENNEEASGKNPEQDGQFVRPLSKSVKELPLLQIPENQDDEAEASSS
jgi:hypothetical protein